MVQEISNGNQLIYMIYTGLVSNTSDKILHDGNAALDFGTDADVGKPSEDSLVLKECNMDRDTEKVKSFVKLFKKESKKAQLLQEGKYWYLHFTLFLNP